MTAPIDSSFYADPQGLTALKQDAKTQSPEALRTFIRGLAIPADAKARLLALTPGTYTGKAAEFARKI